MVSDEGYTSNVHLEIKDGHEPKIYVQLLAILALARIFYSVIKYMNIQILRIFID